MATAFSDLYPFIRAVLGDTNSERMVYANSTLDSQILLFSMMSDTAYEATTGTFTADLTSKQKATVILEVCKAIISPSPDQFEYKTPVLSVKRRGGVLQLLSWLDRSLRKIYADSLVAHTNELDAIFQGPDIFCDALDRALAEVGDV